jgi:hypothetical protein
MSKGGTLLHTLENLLTLTHRFIKNRHIGLLLPHVGHKIAAIADYCENHTKLATVWTKWGAVSVKPGGTFFSNSSRFVYCN